MHGVNNVKKNRAFCGSQTETLIFLYCTALWRVTKKLITFLYLFSLSFFFPILHGHQVSMEVH